MSIALAKARAARILLQCDEEFLELPVPVGTSKEEQQDIRDWIQSLAFDALDAALDEAAAELQKMSYNAPGPKAVTP